MEAGVLPHHCGLFCDSCAIAEYGRTCAVEFNVTSRPDGCDALCPWILAVWNGSRSSTMSTPSMPHVDDVSMNRGPRLPASVSD